MDKRRYLYIRANNHRFVGKTWYSLLVSVAFHTLSIRVNMNNVFYISRLGPISLVELESLFSLVGDVKSIHAEALMHSSVGTRFGIIEMENEQQASDCIERYNGQQELGQTLSLSRAKPVLTEARPLSAKGTKARKR
jgi:hypothetical protein